MIHAAWTQKVEDLRGVINYFYAICRLAIKNPQGVDRKTPLAVLAEMILFSSQEIT
jgi:hypothetical protein